jgi:hypothetical protein
MRGIRENGEPTKEEVRMLKRHTLISVVWVAFFVLCAMPSFAQDLLWCRTYADGGEESGNAVQQTADGGYIIAGWTDSFPIGRVVYLVKLDSLGDTLWARTYSGIYPAEGYSVQQTRDGGYIVAGITVFSNETPAATSVYLVRTDSLGEALWSRTYGVGDYYVGRSVQQTTDGGYIVAGHIYDLYTFLLEVYLIRTDSLGDTLWTRTYGGSD